MRRRIRSWPTLALALAVASLLVGASSSSADIEPPWCGTPEPDSAEQLPPENSFPHIPYYAIGCTLEDIQSRSGGRMTMEVIGQSSTGRDMYAVTINARDTQAQRDSSARLEQVIGLAARNPRRAK